MIVELHAGALSPSTCCKIQLPEQLLELLAPMGQKGHLQRLPLLP